MQLRLLFRSFGADRTPLGRFCLLPAKGMPSTVLQPLMILTGGYTAYPHALHSSKSRKGQKKAPKQKARTGRDQSINTGPSCRGWLRSLCFASIPLQVWAAPKPWGEAVEIILTATRRFPDPLPPAESSSAEHPFGENDGSPPEELDADIGRAEASNVPFWARPGFTGPPVMNHPDLPVPPLDETPEVEDPDEFAQCYCFVMAPHFHAEILSVAVRFPTTVDSFCNQVRSALTALKLRYLPQVVPTFPQIDNGYASLVVTAPWLAAAGKQIVVIDLRPLGGAVYSVIMWERVHYFDCLQEASRNGYHTWSVFVQGNTQPLAPGESFLAVAGGVILFQPVGHPAEWRGPLNSRLDRASAWLEEPELPDYGTEWPLFVTYHDRHSLVSSRRFPGESIVCKIAEFVERTPDRVLLITPPGRVLENIDFHGVSCREAIAVYPLTPSPERDCIVIFLDPRQVGAHITHILLAGPAAAPVELVRFLAIKAPPGFKVSVWPRTHEDGRLHLSEGDVVVFGIVPEFFSESSESDDSSEATDDEHPDADEHDQTSDHEGDSEDGEQLARASGSPARDSRPSWRNRSRSPRDGGGSRNEHTLCATGVSGSKLQYTSEFAPSSPFGIRGFDFHLSVCRSGGFAIDLPRPEHVVGKCRLLSLHDAIVVGAEICTSARNVLATFVCTGGFQTKPQVQLCLPTCETAREHKLLREPQCNQPRESRELSSLRRVTEALGDSWPFTIDEHNWHTPEVSEDEGSETSSDEGLIRWVTILVLKPLYQPEVITVVVQFPTSVEDFNEIVQGGRLRKNQLAFPHLKDVQPQPSAQTPVLIAMPRWYGLSMLVCFDTTRIDNRIFTVEVPDRVDKQQLLMYADLPPNAEVRIFVGRDEQPLAENARIQVYPAITITFWPPEGPPPDRQPAAVLFQQGRTWRDVSEFEILAPDARYCLILRYGFRLFWADRSTPWTYRRRIAESVGVTVSDLSLFPAQPRVDDASIDGLPCNTVLIGVPRQFLAETSASFCFVLDCRQLLQGWICVRAHGEQFPVSAILEEVREGVPIGWCASVVGVRPEAEFVAVQPGAVITVAAVPQLEPSFVQHAWEHSSGSGIRDLHTGGTGEAPTERGTASPHRAHAPDPPADSGRDVSPAQGHRAEAEVQIGFRPFTAVFLILVPAYAQEISILQLGAPATVAEVKAALQNGRSAQSFRRFPHLIEAFPQPDTTFGVLVAVPDWDCMAAFVVVDSRQAGGRLFAAAVPARADRTLLLSVCGFDPNGQFVVYIQDTPWHLVDGPQVRVSHGDLVLVTIPDHPVIVSASLSDMLLSAQGWASIAQVPIQLFGSAWFVADAPHFGFRLPMNIEQQYQRELASYLAVEQEEVVVSPALPSIVDHSTAGRTSGSVFHVRVADNQRSTGMVSCILDLRPIVGSLESVVLPEGLFDGIAFLEGFLPGVPFGFGVGVFGGHPSFGNGPRHVQNGTVLTVEYLTDDQYTLLRQSLAAFSTPAGRDQGFFGTGSSGSNTWTNRRPRHRHSASSQDRSIWLGKCILEGLRQLCGFGHTSLKKSTRKNRSSALFRRRLFAGCLAAQSQTVLTQHVVFDEVQRSFHVDASSQAFGSALDSDLGYDMCAFVSADDAHAFGPQRDTPGISWGEEISCRPLHADHFGCRRQVLSAFTNSDTTPGTSGLIAIAICAPLLRGVKPACKLWISAIIWCSSIGTAEAVILPTSVQGPVDVGRVCSFGNEGLIRTRPIATPVRSLCVHRPQESDLDPVPADLQTWPLNTLLEQSLADPASEAFFLASTLLETLIEHFSEKGGTAVPAESTRSPLSIAESLPSQVEFDVSKVSLNTALPLDQVGDFLGCAWVLPHTLPGHLTLHPATVEALKHHQNYSIEGCAEITSVAVYTDGSFDGHIRSWAFVAVAESKRGPFLFAWAKGMVQLESQEWFIGAPEHSALSAERSAVFWATAWLFGVQKSLHCTIHCDCLVAARQASGQYGATSQTAFATSCRALVQALEVFGSFTPHSICHVRGHQGNPYNELADTIAGTRSLEDSAFPTAFGHLCQWAIHGKLQWLWLSVAALLCPECWPTVGVNGFTDPFGNSTLSLNDIGPSDLFGPQLGQSANASDAATSLQLVPLLITVNVQSLCEDDSSRLPNRVPFAREQLEAFGCAVAGLQETRAKSTTTVTSASHIRFLSGCDSKGCLGVELWFSKTVPFGWVGRTPLLFAVSDFRVLHWTPRMLFVRYVKGALRILFVTCHAPTATSAERTTWWKGFVDLLLQTANGDKVVVLGDLTSRLCDPVANRVGSLVWEQEHAPPEPFFRMLRELDLWIPATFTGCHQGACHTWVAPGGTAVSRIDFILVPSGWSVPIGGSRVLYEVDFGQAGLDHFAAQLSIDTTCIARLAFSVTQQGFDCHRALQPEASVDVQEIVSSVPQVSWDVDAHRHYHVVASHLISELSRRFPVQKGQRRRTFFSDATWALRQQRVWLRRQAHLASAFLSHWEIQGAFIAWLSGNTVKAELISSFGKVLRCLARLQHAVVELRKLKPCFRRSLRQDRSQQLSEIASQAAISPTRDVVQRLRPLLGPPRRKQRGSAPLPALTYLPLRGGLPFGC